MIWLNISLSWNYVPLPFWFHTLNRYSIPQDRVFVFTVNFLVQGTVYIPCFVNFKPRRGGTVYGVQTLQQWHPVHESYLKSWIIHWHESVDKATWRRMLVLKQGGDPRSAAAAPCMALATEREREFLSDSFALWEPLGHESISYSISTLRMQAFSSRNYYWMPIAINWFPDGSEQPAGPGWAGHGLLSLALPTRRARPVPWRASPSPPRLVAPNRHEIHN